MKELKTMDKIKSPEAADILDQNNNVTDGAVPVYFVGPDTKLGNGSYKTVFSTKVVSKNDEKADVFTVPSTLSVEKLVIGSIHSYDSTTLDNEDAKKESKYMRGRFDSNHAPYRCGHCTYFHVGSTVSRRQSSRKHRSDQ